MVLSNVFFVASELADNVFDALIRIMNLYGEIMLQGQRASNKFLNDGITNANASKIYFPYSKVKFLEGDLCHDK